MPRVVAILQARTGSTRLPNKVFQKVLDKPMLEHIIARVRPAKRIDQLVLATTQLKQDDALEELANRLEVACFRGAEHDCLDRFYQAATRFTADVVVRLTGDNPLVDADFIDWVVEEFVSSAPMWDYMDTTHSKTFPLGLSVEIFSFASLAAVWHEDMDPSSREHVTPGIWRQQERFRVKHLASPQNYAGYRWTVDTAEDLELVRTIYNYFQHGGFSWQQALKAMEEHPDWATINHGVPQKSI